MKKIIYLLVLSIFVFNCSKSDSNDDSTETFLEKYEGTVWVYSAFDEIIYLRVIDNLNSPFEYWEEYGDCFDYYLEDIDEYGSVIISKNSNNIFEIKSVEVYGDIEYMGLFTVTVSGNSMEFKIEFYEDGSLVDSLSEYYTKATINVDNLTLCE